MIVIQQIRHLDVLLGLYRERLGLLFVVADPFVRECSGGYIKYGNNGESADIFTKSLPRVAVQRHRRTIMGE